jgi:C1A family cysteine protease
MSMSVAGALGWLRDLPDHRDFLPDHQEVRALLAPLAAAGDRSGGPEQVDWREFCPPVKDQRPLQSCSAHACIGLVEYFERRATGNVTSYSRLFLYKTTRRLLRLAGDTGAGLRTTLKAIALFGLPPEDYLPYDPAHYDDEPDPFLYSSATRLRALHYVRLDPPGVGEAGALQTVKTFLAAGFPSAFGFPATGLLGDNGDVLFPRAVDTFRGGQSVVAVGYDDQRRVGGVPKGALLIRNSWGSDWGEDGYGWLPYEYVLRGLAVDFWTLLAPDWLASGEFTRPSL